MNSSLAKNSGCRCWSLPVGNWLNSRQPLTLLDVPKVFSRISAANGIWRRSHLPREPGQARAEECAPGLEQENRWTSIVGRARQLSCQAIACNPLLSKPQTVVLGVSLGLWSHTEFTESVQRKRGRPPPLCQIFYHLFFFFKKTLKLVRGDKI